MEQVIGMIIDIAAASWGVLEDSALFLLVGFGLAGAVKVLLPRKSVEEKLGGRGVGSVFNASLLGVPLPLCSCSVIPTAVALRQHGAGKGATSAFLISTPESGIDSISISYALLDPLMTIFRPVAAFITALTAGLLETIFGDESEGEFETASCEGDCGSNNCDSSQGNSKGSHGMAKAKEGLRFAFVELMDDLAGWLIFGLIAAGAILALIPEGFMFTMLGDGLPAMLLMLFVGVPMYICATSSTPMAAALILKGLNPGAALVFLLAGPATNIGSIMILRKFMGTRSVIIYLVAIAVCAIGLGFALDGLYALLEIDPAATIGQATEIFPEWIELISALIFTALAVRSLTVKRWRKFQARMAPLKDAHASD